MRYSDKTLDEMTQRLENLAIDLRALQKRQNDPLTRQELQQARNLIGIARDLVAGKLAYEAPDAALPVDPAPPPHFATRYCPRCVELSYAQLPDHHYQCLECRQWTCRQHVKDHNCELPICAKHPEAPHRLVGDLNRCGECGEPGTLLKNATPVAPSPGPALQELISAPGFAEGVDRARVELDRKTEETDRAAASSGKRGPHHWGNEPGGPIECLWCGMKYVDFLERAPLCPGEPAGKHSASTTLGPSDYAKGGGLGGADRAGVSPSPSTVKGEHKLGANSAERAEPERCGVGYSEGGPTCRNAVPCKDHPGSGGPPERHRGGKGSAP